MLLDDKEKEKYLNKKPNGKAYQIKVFENREGWTMEGQKNCVVCGEIPSTLIGNIGKRFCFKCWKEINKDSEFIKG